MLFRSRQRLTSRLVATEAAKQLEQRHADATLVLRQLEERPDAQLVQTLFDDVDHFRAFGELLLDLHERDRVSFRDGAVFSDLRFAVNILDRAKLAQPSLETARTIVAPVLRSDHLASISRTLFTRDDGEDQDLLQRLAMQRPAVFRELFFPLGNDAAVPSLGSMLDGNLFVLIDECGPSWVAPRSEVRAREGLFEILEQQAGGQRQVQIRIRGR